MEPQLYGQNIGYTHAHQIQYYVSHFTEIDNLASMVVKKEILSGTKTWQKKSDLKFTFIYRKIRADLHQDHDLIFRLDRLSSTWVSSLTCVIWLFCWSLGTRLSTVSSMVVLGTSDSGLASGWSITMELCGCTSVSTKTNFHSWISFYYRRQQ